MFAAGGGMMRAIQTCVAGLLGLFVTISWATAEQPGREHGVEQVRFVAPEPTLADGAANATVRVVSEPGVGEHMGYAYAHDDDCVDCFHNSAYDGRRPRSGRRLIGSTCTMGQHHAYFPPMHGYYYFHPYHHSHVWKHQMFARMWGEDPANPYANRVFEMVYEQYRADLLLEQPPFEEE